MARGKQAILWVLLAKRPLRSYELVHALDIGDVHIGSLILATRRFITHTPESNTIQLSHPTVRVIFEQEWKAEFLNEHAKMARRLVKCLMANGTKGDIYKYAATSWGLHAAKASSYAENISTAIMEFLRNKPKVYESCKELFRQDFRGRHPKAVTGVHLAAHFGLQWCLSALADEGASIDERDEYGKTPLLWACRNLQENVVLWLLKQDVDVDARDFELKSALHHAAIHRWEGPLHLLLMRKAKVTADVENMTPLHYAVRWGWIQGIALIVDAGVSVDIRVQRLNYRQVYQPEDDRRVYELCDSPTQQAGDTSDCAGLTALHLAAVSGFQKTASFLLDRGADPAAVSEHGETPLHLLVRRDLTSPGDIWRDNDGWKAEDFRIEASLDYIDRSDESEYLATIQDMLQGICGLLVDLLSRQESNLNINAQTSDGSQALHLVQYGDWSSVPLVKLLLEHGADPSGRNSRQQTPLLLACAKGDAEAARLLLGRGAGLTVTDNEGRNALHCAARSADKNTVFLVLEEAKRRELDLIQSLDGRGRNALHHLLSNSVLCGREETLKCLLEHGADISHVDNSGVTPLATFIGHWWLLRPRDSIELLVEWGADISYTRSDSYQGIGHMYANSIRIEVEVLRVLANAGLSLSAVDAKGQTILHHSARSGSMTKPALEFLLGDIGLSLDDVDSAGKKPIDYANEMANKSHDDDIFQIDYDRWIRTLEMILERGGSENAP